MPSALFVTTVDITLEAFLLPFADHLRERGWTVDALAAGSTTNERIAPHFDQRLEASWSRNPLSEGSLRAVRQVRRVVKDGGYDLVWVHTPVAALVTRFALRRPSTRPAVVYTAHGFHFHKGGHILANAGYRALELAAAEWTDALVTINCEDLGAAQRFDTIDDGRIHLVRGIGVDTDRFRPKAVSRQKAAWVRRKLDIPAKAPLITMVAEFTPNKRHELALAAFERARRADAVLLLVGDGPARERIENDVTGSPIADRVRFAGYREDMDAVLAASDALLLCSAREGLNRSGLEALASGAPVIGTPTRGIADLIGDDESGWLARSHHPDDLAAAIDAAAADAAQRKARGARARERAVTEFSLAHVLAAYDEIFSQALAARDQRMAALQKRRYDVPKEILDLVFAMVLLVILTPLLALIALVVLMSMGRPVFFRQHRPGKDAELFTLYKFRTMRGAPDGADAVEAVATDAERLTPVGRFLRATSLDELPQLLNILRGEMSFIGPRPLLVEYLGRYTPEQAQRHRVRPGITGWAQVNGRNAASWEDRLAMDAWYARHYSAMLDARIALMTVGAVFSGRGVSAEGEATVSPYQPAADVPDTESEAEAGQS